MQLLTAIIFIFTAAAVPIAEKGLKCCRCVTSEASNNECFIETANIGFFAGLFSNKGKCKTLCAKLNFKIHPEKKNNPCSTNFKSHHTTCEEFIETEAAFTAWYQVAVQDTNVTSKYFNYLCESGWKSPRHSYAV